MDWMQKHEGPVVDSLMRNDFYKFTMGDLIYSNLRYRDIRVTFSLINRSGAPLARFIREEDLQRELDRARTLRFNNSDLHYLRGTNEYGDRMFGEDYLQFLKGMQLPPYQLVRVGDSYMLESSGPWAEVMHWEILMLQIVNQLYYRGQLEGMSRFERDAVFATGTTRLREKIRELRKYPGITFSDFGTRRSFSGPWQDYIDGVLAQEMPGQFLGTSNVLCAMKYGLVPMGTSAHELPMVIAAKRFAEADANDDDNRSDFEVLADAQNEVLEAWYRMYGRGLSIALPDTFGSEFFFATAAPSVARDWKGARPDSGDPFFCGERFMQWYIGHRVDPREKLIVFADQMSVGLMIALHKHFRERVRHTFGPGTNLTNDLGPDPISIVVKASKADGRSTVKLSDNLAKAMGGAEEVERYKRAAGYTNTKSVDCVS